ncbi:MAG: hypothetical protein Q9P14_15305, partial [candidate division KSB1 bacterium]|nr:hypothetical protein [candidate division KSB1 bacterium]
DYSAMGFLVIRAGSEKGVRCFRPIPAYGTHPQPSWDGSEESRSPANIHLYATIFYLNTVNKILSPLLHCLF